MINFPEKWPGLSSGSTAQPLLPNLERVIINSRGIVDVAATVDWIPRLLHTELLGLEMFSLKPIGKLEHSYYPWMDSNTSFNLITQIARTCPQIEILSIFPKGIYRQEVEDCAKTWKMVANLQHLRSFTISGTLVHNELLVALGQLPRLETLSLCSDRKDQMPEHEQNILDVPNDSFASLRHLYLHRLGQNTMSCVCRVSALFHHLVTFAIIFESNPLGRDAINAERGSIATQSLGQNSPHLLGLSIHTRIGRGRFTVPWSTIDKFRCMPLRYLDLNAITFDPDSNLNRAKAESETGGTDGPEGGLLKVGWKDLLSSVPHLEELHLLREPFKLHELQLMRPTSPNYDYSAAASSSVA
ncbi:hypothetical protein FRC09_016615 [Ceratobasidium sp. 395]|nr:hypothetical protein FRC09_016615 [Ceratobasidium sp. 395]